MSSFSEVRVPPQSQMPERHLRNTHKPVMGGSGWAGNKRQAERHLHATSVSPMRPVQAWRQAVLTSPGPGACCAVRLPSFCMLFPFFSAWLTLIQTFGSQLNITSSGRLARPPNPSSFALTGAPDTSPLSQALLTCDYLAFLSRL